MAKRIVKCFFCGEKMDLNDPETKAEQVSKTRHAHIECIKNDTTGKLQEYNDAANLYEFIKELFKIDKATPLIVRQINQYHDKFKYSYKGIEDALRYFFITKENDIRKSNGIGIVPHIYEEAQKYYEKIEKNRHIDNTVREPEIKRMVIKLPQARIDERDTWDNWDD